MDTAIRTGSATRSDQATCNSDEARFRYWAARLAGPPPVLELPVDRPRPQTWSGRGGRRPFSIPYGLLSAMRALGDDERVSLPVVLLSALQGLLSRYSGHDDIVVVMPDDPEGGGPPGNVLAIRDNLSGVPSFRELLRRNSARVAEAALHRGLPASRMADFVGAGRDPSYPPLAQSWLRLRSGPMPEAADDHGTARSDLLVDLWESSGGLDGWIEYNSDIFDAVTVDRAADHYRTLLADALADPGRAIGQLALLTPAERNRMMVEWNATSTAGPGYACIQHFVEAQAVRRPDAEAVVHAGRHLTYRELNRRANRLAGQLVATGVGPEILVGICMERSPDMIVAVLGVLKAGGAYVPLDPDYPQDRLDFMMTDARASVLLTQRGLVEGRPVGSARVIYIRGTDEDDTPDAAFDRDQTSAAAGDNLAYVIYTSGSTGRPKGAMLTHQGLRNAVATSIEAFAVGSSDRVLQFAPFSFDVSVLEIFLALASGATLVLADRETVYDEGRLARLIEAERVTVTFLMSSILSRLSEPTLAGVRTIITGGESFSKGLVDRWAPGRAFYYAYGPTEATILQSWHRCRQADPAEPPTIGRPMRNMRFYVLDRHGEPVPVNVVGELYIGGAGLGRGYLHQPDTTAEKFVSDPFSREPGARLYRSGDLARYRPDGNLDFLGRTDTQVKIRGFRVDLGEIETLLRRHPDVRAAAVLVREDVSGDRRLVAYIVATPGLSPAPADLRAFLGEMLPNYMLPVAFVPLEELPLTPNGKIDRRALPPPVEAGRERAQAYVAPRDSTESAVAAIWADLLGVERVGLRDDFFELGGDSMLVVRLSTAIGRSFGRTLPLKSALEATTVEQMARLVAGSAGVGQMAASDTDATGPWRPFFMTSYGPTLARFFDHPVYPLMRTEAERDGLMPIEAVAERFVREIRAIQPEGPYFLGGYSGMGIFAFETASQLRALGQEVALLALFEPTSIAWIKNCHRFTYRVSQYPGRAAWLLLKMLAHHPRHWPRYLRNRIRNPLVYDPADRNGRVPNPDSIYVTTVMRRYDPKHYTGTVTLFMASDQSQSFDCAKPPYREWAGLAGGRLRVHDLPGNHSTMWEEPHVRVLAHKLADCFSELEAGLAARV